MRLGFGRVAVASVLVVACAGCASKTTQWDEASSKVGETAEVCGPVVSYHHAPDAKGDPTFVNIGGNLDDPSRFTIVFWNQGTSVVRLLDDVSAEGRTACATGEVSLYKDVPQIELSSLSDLSIPGLEEVDGPDPDYGPGPY